MDVSSSKCDVKTCCLLNCLKGNEGDDALLLHLCCVVHGSSLSTSKDSHQVVKKEEVSLVTVSAPPPSVKASAYDGDASSVRNLRKSIFKEQCMLSVPAVNIGIDQHLFICDSVVFCRIKNILKEIGVICEGLAFPHLNISAKKCAFVWHLDVLMINQVSGKVWFIVPKGHAVLIQFLLLKQSEITMKSTKFLDLDGKIYCAAQSIQTCFKVIPVSLAFEDPVECAIMSNCETKIGMSLLDAAKYATEVHVAGFDVTREHWSQIYIHDEALVLNLLSSSALCTYGSSTSPYVVSSKDNNHSLNAMHPYKDLGRNTSEITIEEFDMKNILVEDAVKDSIESQSSETNNSNERISEYAVKEDEEDEVDRSDCICLESFPFLLTCPACCKTFRGGKNRMKRLLIHVKKVHCNKWRLLYKVIKRRYRIRCCKLVGKKKCFLDLPWGDKSL